MCDTLVTSSHFASMLMIILLLLSNSKIFHIRPVQFWLMQIYKFIAPTKKLMHVVQTRKLDHDLLFCAYQWWINFNSLIVNWCLIADQNDKNRYNTPLLPQRWYKRTLMMTVKIKLVISGGSLYFLYKSQHSINTWPFYKNLIKLHCRRLTNLHKTRSALVNSMIEKNTITHTYQIKIVKSTLKSCDH